MQVNDELGEMYDVQGMMVNSTDDKVDGDKMTKLNVKQSEGIMTAQQVKNSTLSENKLVQKIQFHEIYKK